MVTYTANTKTKTWHFISLLLAKKKCQRFEGKTFKGQEKTIKHFQWIRKYSRRLKGRSVLKRQDKIRHIRQARLTQPPDILQNNMSISCISIICREIFFFSRFPGMCDDPGKIRLYQKRKIIS